MEKSFKQLWEALFLNRKKCFWAKEQDLEKQVEEVLKETQELKQAIEKNDLENLKEELGDVLMDALFVAVIAEEKGLFSFKEVLEAATEKLKRRKPWVFSQEKIVSKEEAMKKWQEIKAKEKAGKK